MTPIFSRTRVPSEPVIMADLSAAHGTTGVLPPVKAKTVNRVSGAMSRIAAGLFGPAPTPNANLSAEVVVPGAKALYHYREGDLFTPGAENYVFEYPFEYPLQTIWGIGFLRRANTFNPEQPPQVYTQPTLQLNGLGGLVAGQFAFQPLESENGS